MEEETILSSAPFHGHIAAITNIPVNQRQGLPTFPWDVGQGMRGQFRLMFLISVKSGEITQALRGYTVYFDRRVFVRKEKKKHPVVEVCSYFIFVFCIKVISVISTYILLKVCMISKAEGEASSGAGGMVLRQTVDY